MLVINKVLPLDSFYLQEWDHQNRYYFKPAIWDSDLAPSGYYQSGIGWKADCSVLAMTTDWKPVLKAGHYFIRNYPAFLYDTARNQDLYQVITTSGVTEVSGYPTVTITTNRVDRGYYGKVPAFLGNFKRAGDTLIPNTVYRQKRVFTPMVDLTGYVDPDTAYSYANTVTDYEFMIERTDLTDNVTTVTGYSVYGYEETYEYADYDFNVLLSSIGPITGYVTETFTGKTTEVYCKLSTVPVADIQSVVIETPSGNYDITANLGTESEVTPSGWALAEGLPGVVKVYNRGLIFEDSFHPLYDNATISITYRPGLFFVYGNDSTDVIIPNINLNPLIVGSDEYNLLLTNTEVDPVRMKIASPLRRCFIAGHPVELKVTCYFNEAPILNYPITISAGASRLAFNNLAFYGALNTRCNGFGQARCYYVPPTKLDDESFYVNLGHYVPVVDFGYTPSGATIGTATMNGVARVFHTATDARDAVYFPTPKYASGLLGSTLYAIYDKDRIRNNDFISGWGTLRIKGLKRAVVQPARFSNAQIDSSVMVGQSLAMTRTKAEKFGSELNFKFRTNTSGGQTLKFRPYSTGTQSVLVYVNDTLVYNFNETVPAGTYYPNIVEVDLSNKQVLNEEHTLTATDQFYLNHSYVSGLAVVTSGTACVEGNDYLLEGSLFVRVSSGMIDPSGTVTVDYYSRTNMIYTDTVNTVRFIVEDSTFKVTDWDIVDVSITNTVSTKPYDNKYCPAKPIAFLKRVGSTLTILNLSEVSDSDLVDGCIYNRLPHTVTSTDNIIGYYVYVPHNDYIHAHAYTSYGKRITSLPWALKVDAPDYMKGLVLEPAKSYDTLSPYSTSSFFQSTD